MTRSDLRPSLHRRSSTVSSKIEHEIKLTCDPHFRLPPLPGSPIARHRLTATYYDSSQFDLAQAGITLRYRTERGKQAWQLKLPLVNDRQEIEIITRQPHPPSTFCDLLLLQLGDRQLLPVSTLQVWRTGVCVRIDHSSVANVTLDRVSVMKNGTVLQRFSELEIEKIGGKDRILFDLERQLRRAGAEDHDGRPKLFRALTLPAPNPEPPPAPDAPVINHVKWALARQVRWLLAHDPGTRLGREPESLHQMRVAARRLHAILRAARPLFIPEWVTSLQDELRWLGRLLGPARDLDVQLAYFRDESAMLDGRDRRPVAQFIAHLETQRNNAREILLNQLKSTRYLDLIRRLQQAKQDPAVVETTITPLELAKSAFKNLQKAIQRLGSSPIDSTLHEIRIKTKRARYTGELAEPTVGKAATRFIKKASTLQDVLGRHQDALQAEATIRAFLEQSKSVRVAFVAGIMVERQREQRKSARKEMRRLFKGLLKRGEKAWC